MFTEMGKTVFRREQLDMNLPNLLSPLFGNLPAFPGDHELLDLARHPGLGLLHAGPGLAPADQMKPEQPVWIQQRRPYHRLLLHRVRQPHVRRIFIQFHAVKLGRHHSDHGERRPIDGDRSADHCRISRQRLLPIAIADHRDRIAPRNIRIAGQDRSAQDRLRTQHTEEVPRNQMADGLARRPAPGARTHAYRDREAGKPANILEGLVLLLDLFVEIVGENIQCSTDSVDGPSVDRFSEREELLRLPHRERFEHQPIDQREDGCIRANSERQRKHCDCGESRALRQHAQAVACILQQVFDHYSSPTQSAAPPRASFAARSKSLQGERPQEQGVPHTEDRSVGPDSTRRAGT